MAMTSRQRRFEIADLIAIVAGLASLGSALYGAPLTWDDAYNAPIGSLWLLFIAAGVLAVGSVFVAQRARGAGRLMLAVAGVLQLAGAILTGGPWVTVRVVQALLGAVMLGASTSIGRMSSEMPRLP